MIHVVITLYIYIYIYEILSTSSRPSLAFSSFFPHLPSAPLPFFLSRSPQISFFNFNPSIAESVAKERAHAALLTRYHPPSPLPVLANRREIVFIRRPPVKFLACVDFSFFFFFWKRETKRYTCRDWGIGILSDGNIEKESVNTFYVLTKSEIGKI